MSGRLGLKTATSSSCTLIYCLVKSDIVAIILLVSLHIDVKDDNIC